MSLHSKVSWKDGMFLLPQHFQQAERHLESIISQRLDERARMSWGVLRLQVHEDAIADGLFEITRLAAIFPDGLVVDIPDADLAPPARKFQVPPGGPLGVYLTIPLPRTGAPLIAPGDAAGDGKPGPVHALARLLERPQDVPDDHDPNLRQQIDVALKNLRLVFSNEPLDGLASLQIAELRLSASGTPRLSERFVPPVPLLGAAPQLQRRMRDLLGAIAARARALSDSRRVGGASIEISAAEVPSFWFLYTLNQHLPPLRQLIELPSTRPVELFTELSRLCGGLLTFTLEQPLDLPTYQHEALDGCFSAVDARLRDLLALILKQRWQAYPLRLKGRMWHTLIDEGQILREGEFYLVVTGLPGAEADTLPAVMHMGEVEKIDAFVDRAYKGVGAESVPRPAAGVPVEADARYFRVRTDSVHWREEVRKTGQVAAFLPRSFEKASLKLVGVLTGGK